MSSRMEAAVGWRRQVQPEARLSPRATPAEPSASTTTTNTTSAHRHHNAPRPDSFTKHTTNLLYEQERERLERPSIVTQNPTWHHMSANLQPQDALRSLVSPHTPSTDPWRAFPNNDLRAIKASPHHRTSLPNSAATEALSVSNQSARDDSPAGTTSTVQSNTLSLPSFATLREATQYQPLDKPYTTAFATASSLDNAKTAASCQCSQLSPMIQLAADAARKLNIALQRHLTRSNDRSLPQGLVFDQIDARNAGPVQTLQHIIDQLVSAEVDLSRRRSQDPQGLLCTNCNTSLSAGEKSPVFLKRPADSESNDSSKRVRVDLYDSHRSPPGRRPPSRSDSREGTRRSLSPSTLRPLELAQPIPQDSQSNKLLPSPSSLVQTGAAFNPRSRVDASASPPTSSYQPSSSLHNISTSSVASQHIASLERQVSLTSLSLQSLRDEHTSLLQKWHRERTKTQTIEKKCQIADAEINDLSAKNDELTEQIKALESQLVELERKRDDESRSAARDKDQWRRMLEMSDRLHAGSEKRCQRLQDDNTRLEECIRRFQDGTHEPATGGTVSSNVAVNVTTTNASHGSSYGGTFVPGDRSSHDLHSSVLSYAKTKALQSQVDGLRSAMQDAQRLDALIQGKLNELETHRHDLSSIFDKALAAQRDNAAGDVIISDIPRMEVSKAQQAAEHKKELTHTERYGKLGPAQAAPRPSTVPSSQRDAATSSVEAFLTGDPAIQANLGLGQQPVITASAAELFRALGPAPDPRS